MIIAQAPLRISFFGGGTDVPDIFQRQGGAVLSATIDKFIYAVVKPRFDHLIRVAYSHTENVESVGDLKHELVREALRVVGIERGIEIATFADIPSQGSGLGSSSTVTIAVLNALHAYRGETSGAGQLAAEACKIEIENLGRPIGVQDQYAAAFGGLRHMRFVPGGKVLCERAEVPSPLVRRLSESLLLFYTGVTRSASSVLEDQRQRAETNLRALEVMREQVSIGEALLSRGQLDEFGSLLDEAWRLKCSLSSRVTTDQIEDMYARALRAGALGGKIAGAGGGGFLLLYCPLSRQPKVREALADHRELEFQLWNAGSRILYQL